MDKLKQYLRDNEEQMNTDLPGDDLWERMASRMPDAGKKTQVRNILWYVAAACVLACIAIASALFPGSSIEHPVKDKVASAPLPAPAPELLIAKTDTPAESIAVAPRQKEAPSPGSVVTTLEDDYTRLVNMQLNKIRSTPVLAGGPDYFSNFKDQLKQMDEDERTIRKQIRASAPDELLLEKLINIYQQKLGLLKDLQMEIVKMNNRARQQLPADSLSGSYLNI